MIDTDPQLVTYMKQLRGRRELDYGAVMDRAKTFLRNAPQLKVGLKTAELRQELAANRSRLVGLKIELIKELGILGGSKKRLEDLLYSKYYNHLRGISNERARNAMVAKALEPLESRLRQLRTALEVVDLVIGDYESKSFGFRDVVSALKLGDREE
jgi:hypothetical protein